MDLRTTGTLPAWLVCGLNVVNRKGEKDKQCYHMAEARVYHDDARTYQTNGKVAWMRWHRSVPNDGWR